MAGNSKIKIKYQFELVPNENPDDEIKTDLSDFHNNSELWAKSTLLFHSDDETLVKAYEVCNKKSEENPEKEYDFMIF